MLDPHSSLLTPSISVMLDDPHPSGSTGLTEAMLALTYDPAVLTVSASDITLGSIPSLGTGWQLSSVVIKRWDRSALSFTAWRRLQLRRRELGDDQLPFLAGCGGPGDRGVPG